MQSKVSDENQKNEGMLYQDAVYINNIYNNIYNKIILRPLAVTSY